MNQKLQAEITLKTIRRELSNALIECRSIHSNAVGQGMTGHEYQAIDNTNVEVIIDHLQRIVLLGKRAEAILQL